jgi:hypothetical protein
MKFSDQKEPEESTKVTESKKNRKIGRPIHNFTKILRDFSRSNGIPADRENFYIFIVRALIKAIKFSLKGKTLKPVGFTLNMEKSDLVSIKLKIVKILNHYSFDLAKQEKKRFYQMKFIRDFFHYQKHQEVFLVLVEFLLNTQDLSVQCRRFNIFCCKEEIHGKDCRQKWTCFQEYLLSDFLQDLSEGEEKIFEVLELV